MILKYGLLKESFYDDDLGSYESYGIESLCGYKISDISISKKQVENLISKINSKQTPIEYLPYEIDKIFKEE